MMIIDQKRGEAERELEHHQDCVEIERKRVEFWRMAAESHSNCGGLTADQWLAIEFLCYKGKRGSHPLLRCMDCDCICVADRFSLEALESGICDSQIAVMRDGVLVCSECACKRGGR
jgi:hypothetical protein